MASSMFQPFSRSRMGGLAAVLIGQAAMLLSALPAVAQTNPHTLYETRCAGCHEPHAREFAQKSLDLKDGRVFLKGTDKALAEFLTRHPRKPLSKEDAETLDRQLAAMLQTGFLFQEKCVSCHERASVLARLRLIERDGKLLGRYTGRDIAGFMLEHGRLTPDEAEIIVAMLRRQLALR